MPKNGNRSKNLSDRTHILNDPTRAGSDRGGSDRGSIFWWAGRILGKFFILLNYVFIDDVLVSASRDGRRSVLHELRGCGNLLGDVCAAAVKWCCAVRERARLFLRLGRYRAASEKHARARIDGWARRVRRHDATLCVGSALTHFWACRAPNNLGLRIN